MRRAFVGLLLMVGAWGAGAAWVSVDAVAVGDEDKEPPPPSGDLSVSIDSNQTLTLNGPFRGYGVQDDTHMLWDSYNDNAGVVLPDDFDHAVWPRLAAMRVPFVRKFIRVSEFAPEEDVYTWDTRAMAGLYTSLQAHKESGTDVMLTFWRLPAWLAPSPYTFPYPDQEERFAIMVTDLMAHLRGLDRSGHDFTNVKYLGFPNELEGAWAGVPALTNPYELLRKHLDTRGLHDVQLFAPDMYSVGDGLTAKAAILNTRAIPQLDATLAFYDWHSYSLGAGFEAEGNMLVQLAGVRAAVAGSNKQVWNTEFGNFSTRNNQWHLTPLFAIDAANYGQAAVTAWNFMDMTYGEGQPSEAWGLIRSQHHQYRPKVSYFAYRMITSHVAAGSRVFENSCAELECPALRVAAFESPDGKQTVLVYNLDTTGRSRAITFKYTGRAPEDQLLRRHLLDPATAPEARENPVDSDVVVPLVDGVFADVIPPGAFAVYVSELTR